MNAGLLSLAICLGQPAALPPGHAGPPIVPPAPFLFVKVSAPDGAKVTWYPQSDDATTTGATVGLRPGYVHRFALTDVPGGKGTVLYPSIHVLGTLYPRNGLPDVSKHPVPIALSEDDIDQVLDGRLITKFYYLEDPEQAIPIDGTDGQAIEGAASSEAEAIKEARHRGRPVLVVRIGERPYTKDELARENVPGTILLPGMKDAPRPAAPPWFPFMGVMVYDPLLGPKAAAEECMKDGGDVGPRLGVGPGGSIGGLDPTDTAMKFTTRHGSKVVESNRVCICVPRFAAARVVTSASNHHIVHAPEARHLVQPVSGVAVRALAGETRGIEHLSGLIGHQRASGIESRQGPIALVQWSGRPAGMSSIKGTAVVAQVRGPEEITTFRGCALFLEKSIDPQTPEKIGDVVTITLKFSNLTTEDMSDIIIADSLTARLDYVDGSQKSSYPATFSTSPNKSGSKILQWVIDGKLKPGESGKITFQVRIR